MSNYSQLCRKIVDAMYYDATNLDDLKAEWNHEIERINAFMHLFIEKYGDRIMGDKENTPEWVLYTKKTEQYNEYKRAIRQIDYFKAKQNYATR